MSPGPGPRPISARLWPKIAVRGSDDCWLWLAHTKDGYGKIHDNGKSPKYAHRVVYELKVGAIPEGLIVMHTCDTPGCCNPAHLRLGTHADNVRDKCEKGRARGPQVRGEDHWTTRLSDRTIRAIRRKYRSGRLSQRTLAREYGITQAWVSKIVRGEARI